MEHKYLFIAVDAALKAGEEILSIYTDPASDFEIERKADNSPLTTTSYMNDPLYKETVENSSSYNERLVKERKLRLPFIDAQTGVAQSRTIVLAGGGAHFTD